MKKLQSNDKCITFEVREKFKMKKYILIAMLFCNMKQQQSNMNLIVEAVKWDRVDRIKIRGGMNEMNPNEKKYTKKKTLGSKFKFRFGFPKEDDVREFFSSNNPIRINHDFAGITNPWLHLQKSNECQMQSQQISLTSSQNQKNNKLEDESDDLWIPDGINTYQTEQNIKNKNQWGKNTSSPPLRILRYRRKVGNGEKCYLKLRDAALQWEQLHKDSTWAAIKCQLSNRNKKFLQTNPNVENAIEDPYAPLPSDISGNVMQIRSDPGQRKLVTMARVGGKFPLWNLNPCVVMYDLVDCKDKDMTYTSTAYSTLQGHLLAGEERVTVAIHDGGRISNPRLNDIFFISNNNNRKTTRLTKPNIDSFLQPSNGGDVYVEVLSCSRPSSSILGRMIFPFVKNMQERFFQEQIDTLEKIASIDDGTNIIE